MKYLLCFIFSGSLLANLLVPNLDKNGVADPDNNSIMDPRVDYEHFMGRVTDKDSSGRVLKVKVENNNTKFFKAGDELKFTVNRHRTEIPCKATVKQVENFHFVIYVKQFSFCWPEDKYFPRGMQLNFSSRILAQRIFEATKYREILLLKKDGFLKQLSGINNFLWSYDQEKVRVAAKYDERINALKREKRLAVDGLLRIKEEKIQLQSELQAKLNSIDDSLKHYKIERQEMLLDRWDLDQDTSVPVGQRPLRYKKAN